MERLGEGDWIVRFRPTAPCRRKCTGLPQEITCRLIRYQRPGFRTSWLLTSLMDAAQFPAAELIDLYHRRWTIETIYREWKHGLDIQNLRSHTPKGILKEVHAQLVLSNLVRWVMTQATADTSRTPLDLSFVTTLTLLRAAVLTMLRATPQQIRHLYQQLLHEVLTAVIRKRPGRTYPRRNEGRIKNRGYGKRQLPARLESQKP
jgi:hypothetical protein